MESNIIKNKPIINKNGVDMVDLTPKSINYNENDVDILESFFVSKDMVMRADLVSYVAYGNTDYYDIILKFNNISNPFSLQQGEYLFIPEISYISQQLIKTKSSNQTKEIYNQYIDKTKVIAQDTNKLDYINKIKKLTNSITNDRVSKYNLPPNLAQPGKTEAKVSSDGRISLGESM